MRKSEMLQSLGHQMQVIADEYRMITHDKHLPKCIAEAVSKVLWEARLTRFEEIRDNVRLSVRLQTRKISKGTTK